MGKRKIYHTADTYEGEGTANAIYPETCITCSPKWPSWLEQESPANMSMQVCESTSSVNISFRTGLSAFVIYCLVPKLPLGWTRTLSTTNFDTYTNIDCNAQSQKIQLQPTALSNSSERRDKPRHSSNPSIKSPLSTLDYAVRLSGSSAGFSVNPGGRTWESRKLWNTSAVQYSLLSLPFVGWCVNKLHEFVQD